MGDTATPCCGSTMKFGLLAVLTLVVACSADLTAPEYTNAAENGETLKMPKMPPHASDIVHEKDPKAEALLADAEAEDPLLNLLEDAMAAPEVPSSTLLQMAAPLPPKAPTAAEISSRQKAALEAMEADRKATKAVEKQLSKEIKLREKKAQKEQAGFDRFAQLRAKFPAFSDETAQGPALMETTSIRHTKADPEHLESAPVHYSPVPEGKPAEQANADLASGADAARSEDWAVHRATYEALNPNRIQLRKKAKEELKDYKPPTPLKDAQGSFHKGLDTIDETKKIIATPLVKLTLPEAKDQCKKVRALASTKCAADEHDTKNFCLTESDEPKAHQKECEAHKMKDAANCHVAHEAAMPMQHTDEDVKSMTAGTEKCATHMAKAKSDCDAANAKYTQQCKKTMAAAIEQTVVQLQLPDAKDTKGTKQAKEQAQASSDALKEAEASMAKETADPGMKKALEECEISKNVAKRTCVAAIHKARNTCDSLTSTSKDDRDTSLP